MMAGGVRGLSARLRSLEAGSAGPSHADVRRDARAFDDRIRALASRSGGTIDAAGRARLDAFLAGFVEAHG